MKSEFWKDVFQPQWIARALISFALTVVTVWGIAFKTADYVVAANISGIGGTIAGLQSSLDRLNEAVRDNTAAAERLQESIAKLREDSATQNREISFLRTDVTKIADAVQDAGIQIRISDEIQPQAYTASPYILNNYDFITSELLGKISPSGGRTTFKMKERTIDDFSCETNDLGETVCIEK